MQKTRILSVAASLMLLLSCLPATTRAQQTLTVYDESTTSDHVPAYIYYWDDFTKSQFFIPADSLTAMTGATISALTFYTTDDNVPYTSVSTADVYMKELPGVISAITGFFPKSSATVVYSGTVDIVAAGDGGTMTITFAIPYTYNGGNLFIGIENFTDAEYKNIHFWGQTVTGASGAGSNSSSLDGVTFTQQNFAPKTTFTYTPDCSGVLDLPFTCGFESDDNLDCWTFIDADGDGYGWYGVTDDNNVVYASDSWDWVDITPDNWMITPRLHIPAEGATLEWYDQAFDSQDFAEHYSVLVSTTGTATADFTGNLFETTINISQTWVLRNVSLASYAGQDVYIAFRHHNCTGQYSLFIDDINVTAGLAAPTVAVSGPESSGTGHSLTFNANGSSDATFSWTLAGATPATATGTSVTATWSTPGTYDVICTATRGGLSAADTLQVTITDCSGTLSLPFTCGFESDDNLDCWTFIDADGDNHGWYLSNDSYFSSSHYGVALTPDNWMITPRLHIPAEGATLEWQDWADNSSNYAEHYSVLVSTTGTATADFTGNLFETTLDHGHAWTQRNASLASYAGQDVYIAFRHYNCTDQGALIIDDISIRSSTVSISAPDTALSGTTVTFTANGPSTGIYAWAFPSATPSSATGQTATTSWAEPGTYTATLTAVVNGVTQTLTHDIVITDANAVSISAPATAVSGATVTFTANGPASGTYVWAFPGATPSAATGQTANVTWAEPGTYTATLTAIVDGNTQTLTHDIVITDANAVTIDAPATAAVGETVTFTAVGPADATYVWTFPGATPGAATTQTATASWAEAGTYTVALVAVVNGEAQNLTHDITISSTGIDGVDAAAFALFPNPATATVTVDLAESAQVTLLDLSGREVFRAQLPAGQHSLDLSAVAAGTYFARVTDAHGTAVRKLLVQ